tara:strand:+ start:597 stop:4985 length:4389 start_codon:yes stop_codon:yes gene_type:complete
MSKGLQTFVSYKYLKDAAGIQYLVLTSHETNPVNKVKSLGKGLVLTLKSSAALQDGNLEQVYIYTGSGSVEVTFSQKQTLTFTVTSIPRGGELPVTFDSLERSFSFDVSSESILGYDIADALYYGEGTARPRETFVTPQSSNSHLDTSSRKDFYYLTGGSTAYIGSTSLQNKFLNDIGYNNSSSDSKDLGRFRGGLDDRGELLFLCSPTSPDTGATPSSFVAGGILVDSLIPREDSKGNPRNEVRACLDDQATNYYLKGCTDQALPCVDSGTTHANDCTGSALSADIINNSIIVDGGCCEYTTGCEDFDVVVTGISDATVADDGTANGFITVNVINGTQNYTVTVDESGTGIDDPTVSFSTITMNNVATDTITIPSSPGTLHPGYYAISVTDSTSGTACNRRFEVYIPLKTGGGNEGEGDFGCKSTSTAINHDSSVDTHQDSLCVFCDADSGLLFADANNPTFLGSAFDIGAMSTEAATSTPEGVSLTNGSISGTGVDILNFNHVLSDDPNLHIFNPEEEFVTDQAGPFDRTLYRIDTAEGVADLQNEAALGPAGNAKAWLTANATSIGTTGGTTGQFFTQAALGPGYYVYLYQWDADGTPNNDPEEEQCYAISDVAAVFQKGCTDPLASNYNTDFDNIPQFFLPSEGCVYPEPEYEGSCEALSLVFDSVPECNPFSGGVSFKAGGNGLILNPFLQNIYDNGFNVSQQNHPCLPNGTYFNTNNNLENLTQYIYTELFCWDVYNTNTDSALHNCGIPLSYADGGTNSDGFNYPSNGASGLHMIVINVEHTHANGTSFYGGQVSLQSMLLSNANFGQGMTCAALNSYGPPVSTTFTMNWGEYGVWAEEYTYTKVYSAAEQQLMLDCCTFEEPEDIPGCTDPAADNYNPSATIDDGSCSYPEPPALPGCTDPTAINYDPAATVDDGSCLYTEPGSWEPFDCTTCTYNEFNQSGFTSQAECEASIEQNSDCCIIESSLIGEDGVLSAGSAGSSSVFNVVTELCDDQSTGQLQITLPNLTDLIANTGCLTYWWKIGHPVTGQFYSNLWGGTAVDGVTADGFYNSMDTSDLITPIGGVGQDSILLTGIPHGVYNVYVYFMDTCFDSSEIQIQDPFDFCRILSTVMTVSLDGCNDDNVYDCTDPESPDYNPLATIDDGSCTYPEDPPPPSGCDCGNGTYSEECCPPDPVCGCPDPNASNYNPNATYYDPSADGCGCEYDGDPPYIGDPPEVTTVLACVPKVIDRLIEYNNECIARVGHRFYTKHITGIGNNCSTMETMKMVIINDLMNRKGLPCIFNCSDNDTPAPGTASNVCKDNWVDSGSLFWNPANAAAGLFNLGVHVKRPFTPNPQNLPGPIYVAISNAGLDIDPFSNDSASGWKLCKTASIVNEKNNYLPNFLKFAHEYCKDCGIPPYRTADALSSKVTDTFNIGGSNITIGGAAFDNTSDQSGLTDGGNETDSSTGGPAGDSY